jgi:hypothetical protein
MLFTKKHWSSMWVCLHMVAQCLGKMQAGGQSIGCLALHMPEAKVKSLKTLGMDSTENGGQQSSLLTM